MYEKCSHLFSFKCRKSCCHDTMKVNLSTSELFGKKKWQTSEKVPLTEMFLFSFSFIHRLKSQAFWCTEACTHFKCGFCFDILLLDS